MLVRNHILFRLIYFIMILSPSLSYAATSLGIGINEEPIDQHSFFMNILIRIHYWQQYFEQLMSKHLLLLRSGSEASDWLILVSLIYGIVHALGPGHGKAVVSSYILSNNETVKRGIMLSFFASMTQGITAITIILIVFFFLPVSWTKAAYWVSGASFGLLMLLGLYMLSKSTKKLLVFFKKSSSLHQHQGCCCSHEHFNQAIEEKSSNLTTWLSAIFSVGLRPCTGALLIMSFAVIHNLYIGGIIAVLAMSFGTFITIASLAILASHAKKWATRYSQRSHKTNKILIIFEWLCSLFIFLIGTSLMLASFV